MTTMTTARSRTKAGTETQAAAAVVVSTSASLFPTSPVPPPDVLIATEQTLYPLSALGLGLGPGLESPPDVLIASEHTVFTSKDGSGDQQVIDK